MNTPLRLLRRARVPALVLPLLLGACAGVARDPNARVVGTKIVTTEYEYVTVTGSNIPVKKPKYGTALDTMTSNVGTMSPDAFRDLVTRGNAVRR